MRTYDIAYVPRGTVVAYPPKPLKELSLDEIKKKYLTACAKANGDVNKCRTCQQCEHGRRAVQLSVERTYTDDGTPLYDGMTLVEKAKQENMLRRKEKEQMEKKVSKDNRSYIEDWYNKAMASEDPVKWVMEAYGIDKTKAKAKLYQWRLRHKEESVNEVKPVKEIKQAAPIPEGIETKMDKLMKLQEQYKQAMTEMQKQYDKMKAEYEEIGRKIDVLCSAMDIINE